MGTLAISICAPPRGELATSSNGSSPTAAQIDEELQVRQRFIEAVSPYLTSLLVTVDVGDPGIAQQLSALLPKGSLVSVAGYFGGIEDWPSIAATELVGATAAEPGEQHVGVGGFHRAGPGECETVCGLLELAVQAHLGLPRRAQFDAVQAPSRRVKTRDAV